MGKQVEIDFEKLTLGSAKSGGARNDSDEIKLKIKDETKLAQNEEIIQNEPQSIRK